jgi:hypothetical protein
MPTMLLAPSTMSTRGDSASEVWRRNANIFLSSGDLDNNVLLCDVKDLMTKCINGVTYSAGPCVGVTFIDAPAGGVNNFRELIKEVGHIETCDRSRLGTIGFSNDPEDMRYQMILYSDIQPEHDVPRPSVVQPAYLTGEALQTLIDKIETDVVKLFPHFAHGFAEKKVSISEVALLMKGNKKQCIHQDVPGLESNTPEAAQFMPGFLMYALDDIFYLAVEDVAHSNREFTVGVCPGQAIWCDGWVPHAGEPNYVDAVRLHVHVDTINVPRKQDTVQLLVDGTAGAEVY